MPSPAPYSPAQKNRQPELRDFSSPTINQAVQSERFLRERFWRLLRAHPDVFEHDHRRGQRLAAGRQPDHVGAGLEDGADVRSETAEAAATASAALTAARALRRSDRRQAREALALTAATAAAEPAATAENERNGRGTAAASAAPAALWSGIFSRGSIRRWIARRGLLAGAAPSATGAAACRRAVGARRLRQPAYTPLEAVHALLDIDVHRADDLVVLQELDLALAHSRLRQDVDRRAALRILSLEFAIRGVTLRLRIVLPQHRGSRVEQLEIGRVAALELLERRDLVADPDRAPVRRDDEIAIAGVNQNIVHPHAGEAGHELLPFLAAIQRNEKADLGAGEQQ